MTHRFEWPFVVIDTETTSADPATAEFVEVAAVRVRVRYYDDTGFALVAGPPDERQTLCKPTRPIPAEASGVHHIGDADVAGAPDRARVDAMLRDFIRPDDVLVAHNAAFDRAILASSDLPATRWLCTMRLAHHLMPGLANYKLGTVRWACTQAPFDFATHRAMGDVRLTIGVLQGLLAIMHRDEMGLTPDDMIALADSPYDVTTMPFGKHRGARMDAVPEDYLAWALRNMAELDDDLRSSMERRLADARVGGAR